MKIAFLNDGAYEYAVADSKAVGGTERDTWLLSRALAASGWSVCAGVLGLIKAGERQVIEGVEYVGMANGHIGQRLSECYRFLSSERPDWLFWEGASHWWGPLVETAKLLGIRTIFHAAFDADLQPRHALFWRSRWWPLYAWGLWRTDRILVQHMGQFFMLPARLRSRAHLLPKVCPQPAAVIPHSQRPKYVAWVAMLRQPKRPDVLIEIARRLPDVRFVVCGGPTDYQSPPGYGMQMVSEFAKLSNVDYLGRVRPEEAMRVIANAAVLLCTSDAEGFPNTFVQAWSSGTPVITLKIDPDRIIEKLGLGTVSGSVDVAIADIKALINSPRRREEIAARARCYISENHDEAAVVKTFNNALRDVRA